MQTKLKNLLYIIFPLIIHLAISELLFVPFYLGKSISHLRLTTNYILIQNLLSCCISIPVFYYMHRKDQRNTQCNPVEHRKRSFFFYAGLLILGAFVSQLLNLIILSSSLPEHFPGYTNTFSSIMDNQISIVFVIWTVLAAPISEELLFRWLIYKRLRTFCSVNISILLSALLFGLLHRNMLQFIYAFLIGMILARILEYTKSDIAPVLFHIGANLWSLIIIFLT